MEPEGSLSHSQEPTASPCFVPDITNLYCHIVFFSESWSENEL
jgi:hypothetical protein